MMRVPNILFGIAIMLSKGRGKKDLSCLRLGADGDKPGLQARYPEIHLRIFINRVEVILLMVNIDSNDVKY